jgi:protoporphyrinogen oxidase
MAANVEGVLNSYSDVVIVGAGPCGLACARELQALGTDDFLVVEARGTAGGLAASIVDEQGFTWDRGGHVVFSHFGEFDRLLAEMLGDDLLWHERSSYVHLKGRFIPYPFQNNLHHLALHDALECITGLVTAQTTSRPGRATNFEEWMSATFGAGIVDRFMRPYNEKVWATPLHTMSSEWIAERVAVVDWQRAIRALIRREDDTAWGPNNRFAFPRLGGTGEIFRRLAARIGERRIRFGESAVGIDLGRRVITLGSSEVVHYGWLVWTGPLDQLIHLSCDSTAMVRRALKHLGHTSVTVVGIGYEAPVSDNRSWLYFPEPEIPFYRLTNFAKYSPAHVPGGRTERYSSYMAEISRPSSAPPPDEASLVSRVDGWIRTLGLVPANAPVASTHVDDIAYAYPIPTTGRDQALAVIQPWLERQQILARGRFGSWRYERGNMDHAVKMGIDAARHIHAAGSARRPAADVA